MKNDEDNDEEAHGIMANPSGNRRMTCLDVSTRRMWCHAEFGAQARAGGATLALGCPSAPGSEAHERCISKPLESHTYNILI